MPVSKGYKQSPEHIAKRIRKRLPDVEITCRYCGAIRSVPSYYATRYSTCGLPECIKQRRADVADAARKANTGLRHPPEVNAAKGRPGRPQMPDHVTARTEARKAKDTWFAIPDIKERIRRGKALGRKPDNAGPKNPMWRGGLAKLRDGNRQSSEYVQWRLTVLGRTNYACQKCNSTKNVIAHHIQSWHDAKLLRTDPSNGVALCRKCHAVEHQYVKHFTTHFSSPTA